MATPGRYHPGVRLIQKFSRARFMIDIERLIVMIMLYRDSGHTSPFFLDFGHSIRPHSIAKGEQNCKKA